MTIDRKELAVTVAALVAKNLPPGFVEECVTEAIERNITSFKIDDYHVHQALKEVLIEQVKVLLRTKFAAEIEAKALEAATRAVERR